MQDAQIRLTFHKNLFAFFFINWFNCGAFPTSRALDVNNTSSKIKNFGKAKPQQTFINSRRNIIRTKRMPATWKSQFFTNIGQTELKIIENVRSLSFNTLWEWEGRAKIITVIIIGGREWSCLNTLKYCSNQLSPFVIISLENLLFSSLFSVAEHQKAIDFYFVGPLACTLLSGAIVSSNIPLGRLCNSP